jgi:predicted nuclease with TOPRIM domain
MSEDIIGQIKDIKGRTWQEAFYIQTKAFLEKNSEHLKEIERLKAEVEELKLENSQYEEHHKYGQNVIASLREEVERLTKAGDEVIREWSSGDETAAQNFLKALVIWNAAKEGKGQP